MWKIIRNSDENRRDHEDINHSTQPSTVFDHQFKQSPESTSGRFLQEHPQNTFGVQDGSLHNTLKDPKSQEGISAHFRSTRGIASVINFVIIRIPNERT